MASRLKRSNCPKWFFFSKNNKIFMYLLAPFILQIFKRILRADPELSGCVIFGNKMAHLFWTNFFWYKPLLLLLSTCWPFALCKIYKKFLQRIQSYEDGPKMVHLSLTIFLENYYHYYPFHCAKFQKKSFQWIQSYEDVQFLGIKWPICPDENFSENLLMC